MSRSFDGTNQLLTIGSAVVDATAIETTPILVSMCIKRGRTTAAAVERLMIGGVAGATNNMISLGINIDDTVFCRTRTTGDADATSTATITDTTNWHLIVGYWGGIADRWVGVDGNTPIQNTTSRDPSTASNLFRLGAYTDNASPFTGEYQGLMAYVTVWTGLVYNQAQLEAHIASLWNGGAFADPLTVANANIIAAWDLTENQSPEIDDVGAFDLTVTGATFSTDNPFTVSVAPNFILPMTFPLTQTTLRM